jgi:uncharacterized protein YjbJ (UPF0337 family)
MRAGEFLRPDRRFLRNLNHGPGGNAGGGEALKWLLFKGESQMSSTSDKVKGTANQVAGEVKQGVGEATDDPALKGEGKGQETKGDLQKAVGNAKSAIKKAADL